MAKYFGQYLIQKGIVSHNQVERALAWLAAHNRTVGQIAVERGYLRSEDANRIHELQRQQDRFWGEISVELNLLKPEVLQEILKIQSDHNLRIGEALVELQFIQPEKCSELHRQFYSKIESSVPRCLPSIGDYEQGAIILEVVEYLPRLALRWLKFPVKVGVSESWTEYLLGSHLCSVSIDVKHVGTVDLGLSVAEKLAKVIASNLLEMEASELDTEMIDDALGELCNLLGGHGKNHSSDQGQPATLGLPRPREIPTSGLMFQLWSPYGDGVIIFNTSS